MSELEQREGDAVSALEPVSEDRGVTPSGKPSGRHSGLEARLFAKKPERRGDTRDNYYLYDVMVGGEVVVSGSRDPEHDLARALLARGVTGSVKVIDGETGKHRVTILSIERAARYAVGEGRRSGPRRVKWKPRPENISPAEAE